MKKIFFVLALILLFAAGFFSWFAPAAWLSTPESDAQSVKFDVPEGATPNEVGVALQERGIIGSSWGYALYVRIDATAQRPKAGDYLVKSGMSYRKLARLLALGPERNEVEVKIIEGWDLSDEEAALAKYGVEGKDFRTLSGNYNAKKGFDPALKEDHAFLSELPVGSSLEGYLFPDTYRVWQDQLPQSLVLKQLTQFSKLYDEISPELKKQGRSLDELMILASIVEREAASAEDKKMVAGIYLNRIKRGMLLQSDATVNYVTGAGRARPTLDDLAVDSPFNTYKYKGLPPAPICNPGKESILAALNPTPSEYLYYLHDAEGKSYYARTLEEHKVNRWKAYGE